MKDVRVAKRYAACGANAAIILGNDQREIFKDDFTPAFLVYAGKEIPNIHPDEDETERLDGMGLAVALPGHVPPGGSLGKTRTRRPYRTPLLKGPHAAWRLTFFSAILLSSVSVFFSS